MEDNLKFNITDKSTTTQSLPFRTNNNSSDGCMIKFNKVIWRLILTYETKYNC